MRTDETDISKKDRRFGFGFICASLFFLFNPVFYLFDILPDVIGYVLLLFGLYKLRDLDHHIGSAYKLFLRMAFISTVKTAAFAFVTFKIPENERGTSILLFVFVFSVLELITLIPAYIKLFDGISDLSVMTGGEAATRKKPFRRVKLLYGGKVKGRFKRFLEGVQRRRINRYTRRNGDAEVMKISSVCFVIFQTVLCAIPEFAALTLSDYDDRAWWNGIYDYISVLRFFAIALSLVFGIVWLIKLFRYFRRVMKDTVFMREIKEKYYNEILPDFSRFYKRRIVAGTVFACIGAFFVIDLFFRDGSDYERLFNYTPDLTGAFWFVSALIFSKISPKWKKTALFSAIFQVVSVMQELLVHNFTSNYKIKDLSRAAEVRGAYALSLVSTVASSVLFMIALSCLLNLIRDAVSESFCKNGYSSHDIDRKDAEKYIEKKSKMLFFLGFLASFGNLLYAILFDYFFFVLALDIGLSAVFAALFIYTAVEMCDSVGKIYADNVSTHE